MSCVLDTPSDIGGGSNENAEREHPAYVSIVLKCHAIIDAPDVSLAVLAYDMHSQSSRKVLGKFILIVGMPNCVSSTRHGSSSIHCNCLYSSFFPKHRYSLCASLSVTDYDL